MSADPTRKPKSGPIPVLDSSSSDEEISRLQDEAASLKSRLDDVTAKLLKAIGGKIPRPHVEAIEGSAPGFFSQRVLVIEDDSAMRAVLSSLLIRLGHAVKAAATGADGLALLEEFKPQIAFIDLGLPGLDGFEIARRMRASLGDRCPLLIAYTAHTGAAIRAAALEAGFDRHVLKPIAIDELMKLLQPRELASR